MDTIRLMVADDEPPVMIFTREVIKNHHLPVSEILEAKNGSEAVALAKEKKPDMILMDIRMPVLDGLKAAELILAENPSIFVVMITAYDDFELVRKALVCGVKDYLVKPVLPEALAAIIEKALTLKTLGGGKGGPSAGESAISAHPLVSTVERYVRENIEGPLRLKDIARAACVSPSHCSRQYREFSGRSLSEYIAAQREAKAREMLCFTHANVTEVALSIGFENISYFSAWFKKRIGLTPLEFRKRHRAK